MLVAVQVVHQVAVAAVLRDDVDGPCGGRGPGRVLREASGFPIRAARLMTDYT